MNIKKFKKKNFFFFLTKLCKLKFILQSTNKVAQCSQRWNI